MNETIKQQFENESKKLPKIKMEAINSINWDIIIEDIGKKFGLIDEEIENLQIETGLLLTGLTSFEDFPFNIENQVGLNPEITKEIIENIMNTILIPISNTIRKDIKNNLESKKITWNQSINFIVSGGDYVAFLD